MNNLRALNNASWNIHERISHGFPFPTDANLLVIAFLRGLDPLVIPQVSVFASYQQYPLT